jgi:arylsulfatase A
MTPIDSDSPLLLKLQRLSVVLLGILVALSLAACSHDVTPLDGPPNIVLLFADDLGYGDLGCYGHPTIRTPNLDGLASEGVRFTSFYAAASSCTPSRAGLLTGRYPLRAGLPNVLGPDAEIGLSSGELTLATVLKGEGYRTKAVGKWHLGHAKDEFLPTSHGFDEYFGLLYSNDMMPPWVQTEKPLQLWRDAEPVEYPVQQSTLTTRYTDEAVKFIEAGQGDPFFLYLAYSMPHVPIHTREDFQGSSRAGLYGDVIETIDWSVGEILRTLSEAGVEQNTIVVFTSDNGPWLNMPPRMFQEGIVQPWHAGSPGPFIRGAKGTSYEGGFRVPAIMKWVGQVPEHHTYREIASTMDLFVTLANASGTELPSGHTLDGIDLVPFLSQSQGPSDREFLYFQGRRLEGIRIGNWKLRIGAEIGEDATAVGDTTVQLFDLEVDPSERYNVAESYPEVVARLRARLETCEKEIPAN